MDIISQPLYFFPRYKLNAFCSMVSHGNRALSAGEIGRNNREKFSPSFVPKKTAVVIAGNIHGTEVGFVNPNKSLESIVSGVDALITNESGLCLATTFADCPPVMFYDPINRVVAIAHSGYKGTVGEIVPKVIMAMREFKTNPCDILVEIGPFICGKCYQFGSEAPDVFSNYCAYILEYNNGKNYYVDLHEMIFEQLIFSGVARKNIRNCNICTYQSEDFFSDRREKSLSGKGEVFLKTGIALIGLNGSDVSA